MLQLRHTPFNSPIEKIANRGVQNARRFASAKTIHSREQSQGHAANHERPRSAQRLINRANDDVGYAAEDRDGYERAGGEVPNLGFCLVVHRGFSRWPPAQKT